MLTPLDSIDTPKFKTLENTLNVSHASLYKQYYRFLLSFRMQCRDDCVCRLMLSWWRRGVDSRWLWSVFGGARVRRCWARKRMSRWHRRVGSHMLQQLHDALLQRRDTATIVERFASTSHESATVAVGRHDFWSPSNQLRRQGWSSFSSNRHCW